MPCGTKKDGKGGLDPNIEPWRLKKSTTWGGGDQSKRAWKKLKGAVSSGVKKAGDIAASAIKTASPIDQMIMLLKSRKKK